MNKHTSMIQFLTIVFQEVCSMEVFLAAFQMIYSYPSCELAHDHMPIFYIVLKVSWIATIIRFSKVQGHKISALRVSFKIITINKVLKTYKVPLLLSSSNLFAPVLPSLSVMLKENMSYYTLQYEKKIWI